MTTRPTTVRRSTSCHAAAGYASRSRPGSRVAKYRHLLDDALGRVPSQIALLAVLMLRGPQTPGRAEAAGRAPLPVRLARGRAEGARRTGRGGARRAPAPPAGAEPGSLRPAARRGCRRWSQRGMERGRRTRSGGFGRAGATRTWRPSRLEERRRPARAAGSRAAATARRALKPLNLGLRFVLELCMLVAFGVGGFSEHIVLGIAAPLAAAVVLGSPHRPQGEPPAPRSGAPRRGAAALRRGRSGTCGGRPPARGRGLPGWW